MDLVTEVCFYCRVCGSSATALFIFSSRSPCFKIRSRLLWWSSDPEAGAGHPPLPEERKPGQMFSDLLLCISIHN